MLTERGFHVGGLERGGREWTPFVELSPDLVRTIVASEDERFFRHDGVDPRGILRALRANRSAGSAVQGGSTITQQLAKSFVGDQRTVWRKLEELVVARRIEVAYSKADIFEAYINRIYFGAGATGIGGAARIFFGTTPEQLTLSQSALLAAVIPAPGRYNPFQHPDEALVRRDRVLDRLFETGLATAEEVERARAQPLGLSPVAPQRVRAPEIARATWREMRTHGDGDWRQGAFEIDTGIDLVRQRIAQEAVAEAAFELDQRQGLRPPIALLAEGGGDAFRAAFAELEQHRVMPAYVLDVTASSVAVWSGEEQVLGSSAWEWAVPFDPDADNHGELIDDPRDAFAPGQVVLLRDGEIVQWPRVEAAYASMDVSTGAYSTLIGGTDSERSEFDRFTQGCRQPGSTFKPIVYSAAFDRGYTPASMLADTPMRIELGPYEEWRPRNADGDFDGFITLWQALIWSRNLPAVEVYRDIGPRPTIARARALGVTSEMDDVESLALGASCMAPSELLNVYGSFAAGGFQHAPHLVTSVRAYGERGVLLSEGPGGLRERPGARLERILEAPLAAPVSVIDERNAYQISYLLGDVVRQGTGRDLRELGFPIAGKTGTTNAYDAWFAGFTARDVAVAWVGSDRNDRPLGRGETGGHLALPLWADAMLDVPEHLPLLREPPRGIELVDIEPETGRLWAEGRASITLPFREGTAPREVAPTQARVDAMQIDRMQTDF